MKVHGLDKLLHDRWEPRAQTIAEELAYQRTTPSGFREFRFNHSEFSEPPATADLFALPEISRAWRREDAPVLDGFEEEVLGFMVVLGHLDIQWQLFHRSPGESFVWLRPVEGHTWASIAEMHAAILVELRLAPRGFTARLRAAARKLFRQG